MTTNHVPSKNLLQKMNFSLTSRKLDYLSAVRGQCESLSALLPRFPCRDPLANWGLKQLGKYGMDERAKKRRAGTIPLIMGINGIRVSGLKAVANARWSSFVSLSLSSESALN
jgi:hypothetical protein